ncbi:sugar-phosphatase [Fusibacter bizertensis]
MSYKLIALDMDGTLFNEKKEISVRNRVAIREARENGKNVVIATGRPLIGIRKVLDELDLNTNEDYVIAFNGALVQNAKTGEVIYKSVLTLNDYKFLYEVSKDLDVHIQALTESYVTTPVLNPFTQVEADLNGIEIIKSDVNTFPETETIVKVMFVDEKEKLDKVISLLSDEVKSKYTIVRSSAIFLEFLNLEANKGVGVNAVAVAKNISSHEVICVGDAGNDIAMINYAGLGVAMGNAYDEVKRIADYVTDTNEEDGVAKVIEKFMLKKVI